MQTPLEFNLLLVCVFYWNVLIRLKRRLYNIQCSCYLSTSRGFFKEIYYTDSIYRVYKDKLQNESRCLGIEKGTSAQCTWGLFVSKYYRS